MSSQCESQCARGGVTFLYVGNICIVTWCIQWCAAKRRAEAIYSVRLRLLASPSACPCISSFLVSFSCSFIWSLQFIITVSSCSAPLLVLRQRIIAFAKWSRWSLLPFTPQFVPTVSSNVSSQLVWHSVLFNSLKYLFWSSIPPNDLLSYSSLKCPTWLRFLSYFSVHFSVIQCP